MSSVLSAINDSGVTVGYWRDSAAKSHGYLAELPNTFVTFDAPGAMNTFLSGINNSGEIVRFYQDSAKVYHDFFAQVTGN